MEDLGGEADIVQLQKDKGKEKKDPNFRIKKLGKLENAILKD